MRIVVGPIMVGARIDVMDNARHAWKLPSVSAWPAGVDRTKRRAPAIAAVLVTLLALALPSAFARSAFAGEAREALEARAAGADARPAAEALFALAQMDDDELRFASALARYRASVARDPSNRYAGRAMSRADHLAARAEGEFAPLTKLERVRRDPARANDGPTVDALLRDAETFPVGLVRVEARLLAAEAYAGRLARPADAIATYRAVLGDRAADPLSARQAARQIIEIEAQTGQLDAARVDARALRSKLDPSYVTHIERLARRRALRAGAIALVAALILVALVSVVGARRRGALDTVGRGVARALPVIAIFAAYVGIAGGVLASKYEAGNSRPFVYLALALLPIVIAARAWGAAGSQRASAKVARAALAAAATMSTAFLVLDRIDPAYLDGFGL